MPQIEELKQCFYDNKYFNQFKPIQVNCNKCSCSADGIVDCTQKICLTDNKLVDRLRQISSSIGWKPKLYQEFVGRTLDEGLELRLGTKKPTERVKSMRRVTVKLDEVPRHFNASQEWRGMISDVRDQGWCGSSWAVSTATVASDRFRIKSRGSELVDLSVQQMLNCVRKQQGCHGGHLDFAWHYVRSTGLVEERCEPYQGFVGVCKVKHSSTLDQLNCAAPSVPRKTLYRTGPSYPLNNETDIMLEVMKFGPVQGEFSVIYTSIGIFG